MYLFWGYKCYVLGISELPVLNVVDLIYYSLTTICERQTVGEEYVAIIQTNSQQTQIPSKLVSLEMELKWKICHLPF